MVKRLTLVFILSVFIMLMFAGGAFATTAKKVSTDGKEIRHVSEEPYPSDDAKAYTSPSRYSTAGSKDESDCFNIIPDPEVPVARLYNLNEDPQEMEDLAGNPAYREKMKEYLKN